MPAGKSVTKVFIGFVSERLEVIERLPNLSYRASYWLCKCKCGNLCKVVGGSLTSKTRPTKSCGCLIKEAATGNSYNVKHGMTRRGKVHPLFYKWQDMRGRCYDLKDKHYNDYGGRGIIVCDEWKNDFKAFYDWSIGNGWFKRLTLDRIDNNGNYEPGNCRFVSAREQANNRRSSRLVEYEGKVYTLAEAVRLYGKSEYTTIRVRLNKGWNVKEALLTPAKF